jgi:hypothetical protein
MKPAPQTLRRAVDSILTKDIEYETSKFASGTRAQGSFETEAEAKQLADQLRREGWNDVVVWRAASGWIARGMKDSARGDKTKDAPQTVEELKRLGFKRSASGSLGWTEYYENEAGEEYKVEYGPQPGMVQSIEKVG